MKNIVSSSKVGAGLNMEYVIWNLEYEYPEKNIIQGSTIAGQEWCGHTGHLSGTSPWKTPQGHAAQLHLHFQKTNHFFFCIRESRTFTCSSCNIVIQPTIVHRVSRTYIVPIQCFGLPPSTPQCFGNIDCSSTVLVERRVFGALRMATPRGGRGVTIGPDTCHSDFIFVSSNFWNTHFLPLLHWKLPGTKLGLHFSVYSKMDPFQASQIYATTENRLDGIHKIWVRRG